MATIVERVQAVRDRLQRQWAWQCLSVGMVWGGIVGCVLGMIRYVIPDSLSWGWIGLVVLAAPVCGALWSALRGCSIQSAAHAIDRCCGLKDRTESALQFITTREDSPVRRLQIADTENRLSKIDPARVAPVNAPSSWIWGLTFSSMAVVLAFLSSPAKEVEASLVKNEVVFAQAMRAEESLEELKRLQEEQLDPELEKLLKELAVKVEELKQPGLDPKEALAKLSEMEATMQEMQKQSADPQMESQLQEIGKALSLSESMATAGQSLSKGEMDKAAEELAKLELPELDRKTEKAITEQLQQLEQNNCEGASRKGLKEALGQLAQGISQGDRSKFKDGTNGLAGECKKQGQRKKLSDLLRKQCQCLCECKSECECECKSMAESNKKGGTKAGTARSGNQPGDKTAKLKAGPQMNITGQESAQGDVDIETESAPEQAQEAVREYQKNSQKYEALSESALESESIPLGHRQTIRKYFEMIRPQGAETDSVNQELAK